jgi:hypothetical protein
MLYRMITVGRLSMLNADTAAHGAIMGKDEPRRTAQRVALGLSVALAVVGIQYGRGWSSRIQFFRHLPTSYQICMRSGSSQAWDCKELAKFHEAGGCQSAVHAVRTSSAGYAVRTRGITWERADKALDESDDIVRVVCKRDGVVLPPFQMLPPPTPKQIERMTELEKSGNLPARGQ